MRMLPGGDMLATTGLLRRQRLDFWDLKTGERHSPLDDDPSEMILHERWAPEMEPPELSSDGSLVALKGSDGLVSLWDIAKSEYRWIVEKRNDEEFLLRFSPDGRFVALGSNNGNIWLIASETGGLCYELSGHSTGIRKLVFSPDGRTVVAGADDQTIRIWDVGTSSHRFTIERPDSAPRYCQGMTFSPDSELILLIIRRMEEEEPKDSIFEAQVWDVLAYRCRFTCPPRTWRVGDCPFEATFSPNSELLATIGDNTIVIFSASTGETLSTLATPEAYAITFSPDGRTLAVGTSDGLIQIWNRREQYCCYNLHGHTNLLYALCFSANGQTLASASFDYTIRIWDLHQIHDVPTSERNGMSFGAYSIAFSPDGLYVLTEESATTRLWNAESGIRCLDTDGSQSSFSSDSKLMVFTTDDDVWLLDLQTKHKRLFANGHRPLFSPDGQSLAFTSLHDSIELWDVHADKRKLTLQGRPGRIKRLMFSRLCEILVSLTEGGYSAQVWNTRSGQHISSFPLMTTGSHGKKSIVTGTE
ncbi:MAG: hypothetical protein Q9222_000704 [Ikaeria aurantiellina]